MNKNELLRLALTTLVAAIVTGATAWFSFGQDKVTIEELRWVAENQTLWNRDKAEVLAQIRAVALVGSRVEAVVDRLTVQVHDLAAEHRVLIEKISRLLEEQRK